MIHTRQLPDELKSWLNDQAQPYPDSACKTLKKLALRCVGIHEEGFNQGVFVERFQRTIGKAEKEPWCMAFVQSLVASVEGIFHVTSGLYPSEHCLTVWEKSKSIQVKNPREGDLVIFRKPGTLQGHVEVIVFVVLTKDGRTLLNTVGGNTSDTEMREGDGIYRKVRPIDMTLPMEIVGYLRPFSSRNS